MDELPEPWKSFFGELDEALNQEVVLHCLGGFAAKMMYALPRETSDVDVLPFGSNREIDSVLARAHEESRLTEMFPGTFKHLRFLALDPYDLALSKIERNSQRDRDDVKHLARVVPFDLEVLRQRFEDELKPALGNPQRESLTLQLWIAAIEEDRTKP